MNKSYSSLDCVAQSGVRLLALRTLTNLTHENDLAAEQMTALYLFDNKISSENDDEYEWNNHATRGVDVLTTLTFELEYSSCMDTGKESRVKHRREMDQESHRYDSTIFCLSTLSNIIEGPGVRRQLTETCVTTKDGNSILWIRWLCRWLVEQTAGFRDAILSIGNITGSRESERELQHNEDDKLVAAGNGCVLLACLMKEPEELLGRDAEELSTMAIRRLILDEMPLDKNGEPTGVTLIINTLKAFCNFYHFSLGDLSLAIVGPVKKLIDQLPVSELKLIRPTNMG
jgi:hypothetical protein